MRRRDALGLSHPAITFSLLTCVLVFGVVVRHPAFIAVGLVGAAAYRLMLKGAAGWRLIAAMLPAFFVLALVNPLLNPMGDTVLATYAGGRPFTLEALCFGAQAAAMFVAVILWFSCLAEVVTSDALAHLLSPLAPALSLVLTMTLRLVPLYQVKAAQISQARSCIGKLGGGGWRGCVAGGASVLSALSSWAFESAVTTADSMRSRGFATGGRTSFAAWRFGARDAVLLSAVILLAAVTAVSMAAGAASFEFFPTVSAPAPSAAFWAGLSSYAVLAFLPTALNVWERAAWRISLSRI